MWYPGTIISDEGETVTVGADDEASSASGDYVLLLLLLLFDAIGCESG